MYDSKDRVAASIAMAQAELEKALMQLETIPTVSYGAVAFAAHALNNFLSVTGGTTELLALMLADYPEPRVQSGLATIRHSTHLMGQIVAALMKDALIAGQANIIFAKVDLVLLLQTICYYFQSHADRKQIHLLWIPPQEMHCYAWTDRTAIAAVMDNLLSNAIKYSPHGRRVWISLESDAEGHVCSVRDEGPGISLADQEKLFQRGARLSATPTGGEVSHGYGLAVAKELLDMVGGTIWCESEPGAGAVFRFRVPADSGQEESPAL
jgi:signal transduction histidine kinase